ncbi:MAG TPA: CoA transferase, partial [Tepidiformaceae bacterium]|nr:CoA transferase [Tepidiformaceae bacterium]
TYRLYATADGWVFVAAVDPAQRSGLAAATGTDLSAGALGTAFASNSTGYWLAALAARGVPAADPVRDLGAFVAGCPELQDNGVFAPMAHPYYGSVRQPGPAPRFSLTPPRVDRFQPWLGEHTAEVMRELGFSGAEIEAMQRDGTLPEPARIAAPWGAG